MESFATVINVQPAGGPAGSELTLVEDNKHLTATLRDYEGSPNPFETKLRGTIEDCNVVLSGKNVRGRVEIRGRLAVATFEGTIRREIGKAWHSERVILKRRTQETDKDAVALFPKPFSIGRPQRQVQQNPT